MLSFVLIAQFFNPVLSQTGQSPYPILFIHGLKDNDIDAWAYSISYLDDHYGQFAEDNVFHAVLNAQSEMTNIAGENGFLDSDNILEDEDDDVLVNFVNENNTLSTGNIYTVNFKNFWNEDINAPLIEYYSSESGGLTESDGNESSIYKQGYALKKAIEAVLAASGRDKVILVGHSMGGLAAREYLQRRPQPTEENPEQQYTWWVDPNDHFSGHHVAKLITIGTPHLGSNFVELTRQREVVDLPDPWSEASRDLRWEYNAWGPDYPGVYLYGGNETDIQNYSNFHNYDVNCDGDEFDEIVGISQDFRDNISMPLPQNIDYTWITSTTGIGSGDGVVALERQWLHVGGESIPVNISDTLLIQVDHGDESEDYTTIIRGLDEPDQSNSAYELQPDGTNYLGFTTYQPNMGIHDVDCYYFSSSIDGYASVNISDVYNTSDWEFEAFTRSNETSIISIDQGAGESSGALSFSVSPGSSYLLKFTSSALQGSFASPYSITVTVSPETGTVTDIDGNTYQTVRIGNRWWMAENLKVTRYRNEDGITKIHHAAIWSQTTEGAYCNYDNDDNSADTYGSLYNWYAVNDSRKVAPEGWHIPTDAEFKELELYLGMSETELDATNLRGTNEGGKLKEETLTYWNTPNTGATNESGFTGLPGGYRGYEGGYIDKGINGHFWSQTGNSGSTSWHRILWYNSAGIDRQYYSNQYGFSIRCVKDDPVSISVPQNLTAAQGDKQITLNWNDHTYPDLAAYNIYRGTTSSVYSFIESVSTGSPITSSYSDTDLNNGTTYYYVVTAMDNSANESGYSNEVSGEPQGLIAFYPFNGNAEDESGNAMNGILTGDPTQVSDRFGNYSSALHFNGVDQYIDLGTTSHFHTNELTGMAWIKLDVLPTNRYYKTVVECTPDTYYSNELVPAINPVVGQGEVFLRSSWANGGGQTDARSTTVDIIPGQWHHIAYTRSADLSEIKFYFDGNYLTNEGGSGGVIPNSSNPVSIGRLGGMDYGYMNGSMDEVRIYNIALSQAEIESIYSERNWPNPETVSNINISQRTDGSKWVDIVFNLTGSSQYYQVTPEVSLDGGTNYATLNNAVGDIGFGVTPGLEKHIEWDVNAEYPNQYTHLAKIRINAVESDIQAIEWATIAAGSYIYGENLEVRNDIDYDFEIMKYEVTNAQYVQFLEFALANGSITVTGNSVQGYYEGSATEEAGFKEYLDLDASPRPCRIEWVANTFQIESGYENHPVTEATWFGANAYALHYGYRLPTEHEWEKSARGYTGYIYPWGDNSPTCTIVNYNNSWSPGSYGCVGNTQPVGIATGSSPYGVFDMAGNVYEYCDNLYDPENSSKVARGGSWMDHSDKILTYHRRAISSSSSWFNIGFRCIRR